MKDDVLLQSSVDFFRSVLQTHSSVERYSCAGDHIYHVKRKAGSDVEVYLTNLYTIGIADYVDIRSRFPDVNCIVVASMWNSYTSDAKKMAVADRIGMFDIKEFMGAINYEALWKYLSLPTMKRTIETCLNRSQAADACQAVYVFGSYYRSSTPEDVDVLFVYNHTGENTETQALRFRNLLVEALMARWGLTADVILLTKGEEEELQYIRSENARRVWP